MIFPPKEILSLFKSVNGACSVQEGVALYNLASMSPEGPAIELGSHEGKMAIMEAAGFQTLRHFHLVDPLYDFENREAWKHAVQATPENAPQHFRGDHFWKSVVERVFEGSKKDGKLGLLTVECHGDFSTHAIPSIGGPFSYCLIDSDVHAYQLCHDECELLRDRMVIGGIIAFHDFGSQFEGVERAYREMLQGGMYEEIPIPWGEIKAWVRENDTPEPNVSWHKCEEAEPCYLGALIRVK